MKFNGLEKFYKTNIFGKIVDFKQTNQKKLTPLMFALAYNHIVRDFNNFYYKNIFLTGDILKLEMILINYNNSNLISKIFKKKFDYLPLNLNQEQFKHLIINSHLLYKDYYGLTPLLFAIGYNINLNEENWNILINNSDLLQKDLQGYNAFIYSIIYENKLSDEIKKEIYLKTKDSFNYNNIQTICKEEAEKIEKFILNFNLNDNYLKNKKTFKV